MKALACAMAVALGLALVIGSSAQDKPRLTHEQGALLAVDAYRSFPAAFMAPIDNRKVCTVSGIRS